MRRTTLAIIFGALLTLTAQAASANPVTVQNTGTSPGVILNVSISGFYTGGVYVGVENLLVDGVLYQGFCIDLHRFASSSSLEYTIDPLASSPLHGPAIGETTANLIKEMWAQYYAGALTDANTAAGLQLAIWSVIMGVDDWTWLNSADHYGADEMIAWANTHDGPLADLVALNRTDGSSQSYAIQGVPDGGATVMLLGGALMALGVLRRKFRA